MDAVLISTKGQMELERVLRSRYGFAPRQVAQALEMVASLGNAVVGERKAVRAATARADRGWDFADALHHAPGEGCDDFVTLDADLAQRALRGPKAVPPVVKL